MTRYRLLTALFFSAFALLPSLAARADTSGSWMGNVVYINDTHIGVKAHAQTRDFILSSDTGYFSDGKKVQHSDVTTGMLVVISYTQSSLFGSTRATRVDVKTFAMPAPTEKPRRSEAFRALIPGRNLEFDAPFQVEVERQFR